MKEYDQRTLKQNASLHLYCEQLAEALNDAGYEMKAVLAVKQVDVPWNKKRIKEVLFKTLAEAMFQKTSTTDLTTVEMSAVYTVLDRHISSHFGVHVEWPHEEETDPRNQDAAA